MTLSLVLLASLALGPGGPIPHPREDVTVTVTVDSSRHEVRIKAGPFFLPSMAAMDHAMMDMGAGANTPVYHFAWPVDGWMRGFKSGVEDAKGNPLPKSLMHHMIGMNYSRRQAIYPAIERLFGAGRETADAKIPATIGVPMKPGMDLGFYIMWHNETGKDVDGVYMTMTLFYSPKNQNPRPVEVLPLYMDANLTVGGSDTYDLPLGKSEKAYEFTFPLDGRLLGYGGHLHDYGVGVRLEDVASGKVIARVRALYDKSGMVTGVSRSLPGVGGAGLKLKAGRVYRIVGEYNNTSGKVLHNGAMAHITGIFAPDDMSKWPAIDESDPWLQRDLASLEAMGNGDMSGMDMESMDHQHPASDSAHTH
jgi:hypothetical protein